MAYSHVQFKENAIIVKIRRAKTMANAGNNPDFKLQHPDWVRDAQNKNYTSLIKKVTDDTKKRQEIYIRRRLKLVGQS